MSTAGTSQQQLLPQQLSQQQQLPQPAVRNGKDMPFITENSQKSVQVSTLPIFICLSRQRKIS
jgi:hypothetical protein